MKNKIVLFCLTVLVGGFATPAMAECDLDSYINAGNMSDQQLEDFEREISRCRAAEAARVAEVAKFEAMLAKMKSPDEMLVDHNRALEKAMEMRRQISFKVSQLLEVSTSKALDENLAILRTVVQDKAMYGAEVGRLQFQWKRLLSANEDSVGKDAYAYLSGQIPVGSELQDSIQVIRNQFPAYFWDASKVPMEPIKLVVKSNELLVKAISLAEAKVASQFTDNFNKQAYGQMLGQVRIYKADLYWNTVNKRIGIDDLIKRSRSDKYFGVTEINVKELQFVKLQLAEIGQSAPEDIKKPLSEKIAKKLSELELVAADLQKQDTEISRKKILLSIQARENKLKAADCAQSIGTFDKLKIPNKGLELYYMQLDLATKSCRGMK